VLAEETGRSDAALSACKHNGSKVLGVCIYRQTEPAWEYPSDRGWVCGNLAHGYARSVSSEIEAVVPGVVR
jgi:hypothetical protein